MGILDLVSDVSGVFDAIHDMITALPVELVLLGTTIFGTWLLVMGFRIFKDW